MLTNKGNSVRDQLRDEYQALLQDELGVTSNELVEKTFSVLGISEAIQNSDFETFNKKFILTIIVKK